MVDVVIKETRKQKFICSTFLVSKKFRNGAHVENVPMVFVSERESKRLIGDKFNPAYMSEVKGTTGKG
jgi:hypothetical protein